jgi:hypothetical protein
MNAAEIVIGEVQGNRGFQVRQLFAERIREPRKTPHRHPHGQVLPLHVAGRNFVGIGIAASHLGYNLRDPWWGVPRVGVFHVPKQFHKLREVNVGSETLGHAHGVVIQPVSRELHAIREAMIQVPQKCRSIGPESLANVERGNQLGFRVDCDVDPLVADFGRIAFVDSRTLLVNERPDFIDLQIASVQVPHSRVHQASAALSCNDQQTHDRIPIQPRKPFRAANRAAFKKAMQSLFCGSRIRYECVSRQFVVRFAESGIAGSAAPALNAALTEVTELLAVIVLAFPAGHAISPLDLREETCDHELRSEARVTPRFGLSGIHGCNRGYRVYIYHYGGLIARLLSYSGCGFLCSVAPTNHSPFADHPAKSLPTIKIFIELTAQLVGLRSRVKYQLARAVQAFQGVVDYRARISCVLEVVPHHRQCCLNLRGSHRCSVQSHQGSDGIAKPNQRVSDRILSLRQLVAPCNSSKLPDLVLNAKNVNIQFVPSLNEVRQLFLGVLKNCVNVIAANHLLVSLHEK